MSTYAHVYVYRHSRKHVLVLVSDCDIAEEYDRLSATRNDALDGDPSTEDMIEWLSAHDDGAARRYVPIEEARIDGIRASGHGRSVWYSAADVLDLLGEIEHGDCADCDVFGPFVDTPDGGIFRDGEDLGRVSRRPGEEYLCASKSNGDAVCAVCEAERVAAHEARMGDHV